MQLHVIAKFMTTTAIKFTLERFIVAIWNKSFICRYLSVTHTLLFILSTFNVIMVCCASCSGMHC